jgi:hypothetical protein
MIDINKKYRTREGREVRIYATDGSEGYSVHGAILEEGKWESNTWDINGSFLGKPRESHQDLIEVKEKIVRWVNVYDDNQWIAHDTKEEADVISDDNRIACIKIEFEEGEGL